VRKNGLRPKQKCSQKTEKEMEDKQETERCYQTLSFRLRRLSWLMFLTSHCQFFMSLRCVSVSNFCFAFKTSDENPLGHLMKSNVMVVRFIRCKDALN
jgi:hypothetical protein